MGFRRYFYTRIRALRPAFPLKARENIDEEITTVSYAVGGLAGERAKPLAGVPGPVNAG